MKLSKPIVFYIIFFVLTICNGFSKDVKPRVLVYGNNMEAFAAAIQSARSNVPTLWVIPSKTYIEELSLDNHLSSFDEKLIGGIWMNILQEVSLRKEKSDSLFRLVEKELTPTILRNAIAKIIEGQKNLTVVTDVKILKLVNSKKNIDIVLSNKRKLSVLSVVDASSGMSLSPFVTLTNSINKEGTSSFLGPIQNISKDYVRTILTIQETATATIGYTQQAILSQDVGNVFFTSKFFKDATLNTSLSFRCNIGQVVGAAAAYCAFFKTTADKIEVRKLQTELLLFDVRVVPFVDISIEDPNYKALQRIFLVNILPWDKDAKPLLFNPSDSVSLVSVRPVLQQLYTRSQLWFLDNSSLYFTTKDVIELLKVIAFRGNELDEEIAKSWDKRFKFNNEFNLEHTISRYEFAVLLDAYASPFAERVDLQGIIQR